MKVKCIKLLTFFWETGIPKTLRVTVVTKIQVTESASCIFALTVS